MDFRPLLNTADAVYFLEKIPHCDAIAYLIADSTGSIAKVEAAPEAVVSSFSQEGFMVVSNFFELEEMKPLDTMPMDDRAYQYNATIKKWFSDFKGRISPALAKSLCSTHESGICEHFVEENLPPSVTIWSWVAELGMNSVEVSDNPPCQNSYRLYQF